MNGCVPDWDMEDAPIPSSSGFSRPVDKKPAMLDDELVELLWRDGQVVMQSQTQRFSRKSPVNFPGEDAVLPGSPENFISDRHEEIGSAKNHLFIQEDEMASWLHYPLDHSFDREFCTDLFSSIPSSSPGDFCGGRNQQNPAEQRTDLTPPIRGKDKVVAAEAPANRDKTAPENSRASTAIKRHFSLPTMSKRGTLVAAAAAEFTDNATRESRVDSNETPAMGSGNHGSFPPEWRLSSRGWPGISGSAADDVSAIVGDVETVQEGVSTSYVSSCMLTGMGSHTCDTFDAMVTSSSGGSACSGERNVKAAAAAVAAAPAAAEDRKRKAREADESECQSEDIEFESTGPKKVSQQSTSARRTRAAEVHNLSERRRRDRINEKMKALQELIPRSNKADKASMLDEAIEYLKSLQLQVQMMSMGCSMPPMMFPGIQHYMSTMGMGMGMGMEMPGALSRPNFPFPQVVHNSAMPALVPPHFGPRIPMPGFHPPPNSQTDQSRVQATNRPDPTLNLVSLQNLTSMQRPNFVDPYQGFLGLHQMHFPPQNQVSAQPSTSKGAEAPPDHKSG